MLFFLPAFLTPFRAAFIALRSATWARSASRPSTSRGLNRAATKRWLRGEATREQTHELIASTLKHVLLTFGTPPKPNRRA